MPRTTIRTEDITDREVSAVKIVEASIGAFEIQSGGVDTAEIATNAVTSNEIAADAVGASELANDAVDTNAVADNAVTLAKLEDGTQGDILYYAAAGAPTRLAKGTADQVLKINSGATAPEWGADSGGGLKLITSETLTSVVATWDFLECFTSTYTNYLVMISKLAVDTNDKDLYVRFGNSDLSSTTSAGREQLLISAGSTTPQYSGHTTSNGMRLTVGQNNSASLAFSGHMWVYAPYPSGMTTYATGAGQYYSESFVNSYTYTSYGWFGGAQIESIRFIAASGSVGDTGQTARVSIYGLAES